MTCAVGLPPVATARGFGASPSARSATSTPHFVSKNCSRAALLLTIAKPAMRETRASLRREPPGIRGRVFIDCPDRPPSWVKEGDRFILGLRSTSTEQGRQGRRRGLCTGPPGCRSLESLRRQ